MRARDVFESHTGRRIAKLDHYFPIYDRHFQRFTGRPIKFLEIGVGGGGSSQMWKRYFGPAATIVGIDIRPRVKEFEDEQVRIRIGDQSDTAFLASLVEEFGPFDCVLDDGSHMMEHLVATFQFLYPRIAPDGVYVAEDLCCAYWPKYGGGYRREGSFMELAKQLVDHLNAQHIDDPAFERGDFAATTTSMHFYDSIVVFERGTAPAMRRVTRGGRAKQSEADE